MYSYYNTFTPYINTDFEEIDSNVKNVNKSIKIICGLFGLFIVTVVIVALII